MIFHPKYGNDFPIRKLVRLSEIDENAGESNERRNVAVAYEPTRLERLLLRLEAQHKSLNWAFGEIRDKPGPVFELGLGHGRTYDHMRRHLPGREIFVFDREIDCFPDCTPPAEDFILGKLSDTLPEARHRFAGKAVLVNSDVGTYDEALNGEMADVVSAALPALLAPGAIVLSDLPLTLPDASALPLPPGVRSVRYFVYRAA
ncbi:hypothetical protein G5V57_04820 [Nordella sp. HKS 07]|uniref:class I SAM-dependent methyltransferase n=1 Tax=Nordella sp. HKS 07 TaxID=2712222 RepID=UPI0013E1F7B9|nr:class I SAM-dependent methyltransferase [Nordella sp. HKS 07]QIG47120.1 hypothetical protein G5V57_04820 [Nordella sp. HKS 07]